MLSILPSLRLIKNLVFPGSTGAGAREERSLLRNDIMDDVTLNLLRNDNVEDISFKVMDFIENTNLLRNDPIGENTL